MSKTMSRRAGLCAVIVALAGWGMGEVRVARADAPAAVVDTSGPAQLIQSASQIMLKSLASNREHYRKDKAQLYKLVDDVLLPNFDVNFAAQQVLGKHWREADETQRNRFVKAFYHSLLQTYGDEIVDFTEDRLRILPFTGDPSAARASVRTEIRRDGGAPVQVAYSLRKTADGWKVWDVVIEGISYVKSFQEDYGPEVDQKGLDSLIERLESGALKPAKKT